jgi:hypothetical protein
VIGQVWITSLLTSAGASIGRLAMVGLLPNSVLAVFTWMLIRAHSFQGRSTWDLVLPREPRSDVLAVVLFLAAIVVCTVILQPLQVRLVRLLEGYWEGWALTARLAPLFAEYHRRKTELSRIRVSNWSLEEADFADDPRAGLRERAARNRRRARITAEVERTERKLSRYPATPGHTLPTSLGNALRVAETTAGQRYGLDTLSSWSRLYPHLSDRLVEQHDSARDALDAAVNLSISFFLATVAATAALYDEPAAYWIPLGTGLLCCAAYVSSVAAAEILTTILHTAYDLHRFDMLKALHYELPDTHIEETETFSRISEFFRLNLWRARSAHDLTDSRPMVPYDHTDTSPDPGKPPKEPS